MTRAAIFYGASALGCAEAPSAPPAESVVAPPMQPVPSEAVGASATEREAIEEEPFEPLPAPRIEPDTEAEAREERADAEDLKRRLRMRRVVPPPPPPCCPPYGAPPFDFVV